MRQVFYFTAEHITVRARLHKHALMLGTLIISTLCEMSHLSFNFEASTVFVLCWLDHHQGALGLGLFTFRAEDFFDGSRNGAGDVVFHHQQQSKHKKLHFLY